MQKIENLLTPFDMEGLTVKAEDMYVSTNVNRRTFDFIDSTRFSEDVDMASDCDSSTDTSFNLMSKRVNNESVKMKKYEGVELDTIKSDTWMDDCMLDDIGVAPLDEEMYIKIESDACVESICDQALNSSAKEKIMGQGSQLLHNKTERGALSCNLKTRMKKLRAANVCAQSNSGDDVIENRPDSVTSECSVNESGSSTPISKTSNTSSSKLSTSNQVLSTEVNSVYQAYTCLICNIEFKSKVSIDDHIIKIHPECITSVTSKIHECKICSYKTTYKQRFDTHMLKHPNSDPSYRFHTCIICSSAFKSKIAMDDHIVKQHPKCIESVASKIHECKVCMYKTTFKHCFDSHMLKHPESNSTYKFHTCIICKAPFKNKISMNDHVVKHHPKSTELVTSKIHECNVCVYKTTYKDRFNTHMLRHHETGPCKFSVCTTCNAKFRSKQKLGDHILKQHPGKIESVTSKIHECKVCSYKTTFKDKLIAHMSTHPDSNSSYLITCMHCKRHFNSKVAMDDHILKKHSTCIASVSSKIHECKACSFKTTFKHNLVRHLFKHPVKKSSC